MSYFIWWFIGFILAYYSMKLADYLYEEDSRNYSLFMKEILTALFSWALLIIIAIFAIAGVVSYIGEKWNEIKNKNVPPWL